MSVGKWKRGEKHCSIPDCGREHEARGLCNSHYRKQRRIERRAKGQHMEEKYEGEFSDVRGPEDLPNVRKAATYQGKWGVILRRPDMEEAKCVNTDPDVFFPSDVTPASDKYNEARAVCEGCPIKRECAEWGLAAEQHGVFGGLSPHQRKRIRTARGQFVIDPWMGHPFAGMEEWDWGRHLTGYATSPKKTQDEEHWEFSDAARERAEHASRIRWGAA